MSFTRLFTLSKTQTNDQNVQGHNAAGHFVFRVHNKPQIDSLKIFLAHLLCPRFSVRW